MIAHLQFTQTGYEGDIKCLPFVPITTTLTHDQHFQVIEKESIPISNRYCCFCLLIIHPLSIKHCVAVSVILNASSPSLSFTPFSYIVHLLDVRVVLSAVAHIHFANSESLIHLLSFLVIQHSPTIGLIV